MPAERRGKGLASLGLGLLAGAAVIGGLLVTGGPLQARKERRDETRLGDLMAMAGQVECLSEQGAGTLPRAVTATEACPFTGRLADPFDGAAYRYEPIDARSWRLCAVFETPPEPASRYSEAVRSADGCTVRHLPRPVALRGHDPVDEAGSGAAP